MSTTRRRGNSEGSNPVQRADGRWQVHIRHTDGDGRRSSRYTVYGSTSKERRNDAVHPYTELEPPRAHPAGLNSSAETAKFNAVESSRAVDIAMAMLELAAAPPNAHGRWVTRWVAEREPYHSTVIAPLRERRATGRPTQVQTTDSD